MEIRNQQRSVVLIDDDGDRLTVASGDSGATIQIVERKIDEDTPGRSLAISLDDAGRRAAIEALGGRA